MIRYLKKTRRKLQELIMDNKRLFIFIGLCLVGLMLFQQWQHDYGNKGKQPTAASPTTSIPKVPGAPGVPSAPATSVKKTPVAPADVPRAPGAVPATPAISGKANKLPSAGKIHIVTDVLAVDIDLMGGDIRTVDLLKYKKVLHEAAPFRLMTDTGAKLFVAQSGFAVPADMKGKAPTHKSIYQASVRQARLADGQKTVSVDLTWNGPQGIKVIKTFTFVRGSYAIRVDHKLVNGSAKPWQGSVYLKLHRTQFGEKTTSFVYTYMGGVISTPDEGYEKIDFSDMKEKNLARNNIKGGWVAMMQHYFLGAIVPPKDGTSNFYSYYHSDNYRYDIGLISSLATVAPGQQTVFSDQVYVGPKIQSKLEKLADGLELTVDYGWLTVIAKPLFWVLKWLHALIGNWGFAIILVTVLIKLAFYKLSETSYRSMAKMRKVQPRMKALKERYGDDRQKMNQALMELYKTEKINPLGGCLPIVVQIPVFIALYWVLLESVELRHAPFLLWIQDLSSQDPYYVLPVLMGISMFIQQKLNPAPLDPLQAKIMMALPLMFTVFFLFFPAGLVLYWVVNNVLSITQQWVITKRIEGGGK
jgi:YidC/Oxa1 family membrane protein insertase